MATVNKKAMISNQQGLPTLNAIMSDARGDTVPAVVNTASGEPAQAALTEGEFVWSIPAIIALGKGDYEQGLLILEQMHEELRMIGEQMLSDLQGNSGGLSGI